MGSKGLCPFAGFGAEPRRVKGRALAECRGRASARALVILNKTERTIYMKEQIIRILQQNARISNTELGEMLGISADEAAAQIKELEDEGIIRGYSVILDDDMLAEPTVYATIELKVTPQRDRGFNDIAKTIMMYDEVESVSLMSSGAYDLAVEVKGKDLKEVAFFVSERLATIDGILSTSTHFILKKYKEKGIFIDNEEPDERGLY